MPTLIINEIECINPKELRADEAFLSLLTENVDTYHLWGPRRMEAGDIINLRGSIDPIQFNAFVRVYLRDHDRIGRDDTIGEIAITPSASGGSAGTHDAYLPRELFTTTGYRINYEIREEPSSRPRNRIELLSLRCDDAQGTKDRVSLEVNETNLWGPHEMETGDTETFENLHLDFHDIVHVNLHETRAQDWTASFQLTAGEYLINIRRDHVFARDSGIVGDARYTLFYRMRRLPAR